MSTGGQALGGLVGGIAGALFGGPTGALYGAQIGLGIGGYIDPPKGPTVEGPRLSDLTVQTSTYGAVIPRVYGTVTVIGNVFWLENNRLKEVVTKKKSGGKGGGSKTTTRTYTYFATFAVGLDDTRSKGAPIAGVRRIWIGPDLWYDAGSSDPDTIAASNAASAGFSVYLGTDTQSPDARMQATLGAANTPAYRGLAYIVFYDLPLAKYGNSLLGAQVKVEVLQLGAIYNYLPTYGTTPTTRIWSTPAWNGTIWCSISLGSAHCLTSTNGLTWTQNAMPSAPLGTNYIASNGSIFVACGYSGNVVYTSSDGVVWYSRSLPDTGVGSICYGNSKFVLVTNYGYCLTSPDGITWTKYTFPHAGDYSGGVIWSPALGMFVSVYRWGSTSYSLTSANGTTWTESALPHYSINWKFLSEKSGTICLTSANGGSDGVLISSNGTSWTRYTPGLPFSIGGIATDGSVFLAASNGKYHLSDDGIAWTTTIMHPTISSNTGPGWNGAVFSILSVLESVSAIVTPTFIAPITQTLSSIVSAECLQSGLLSAGDIDVAALTSSVRGYRIGSVGSIRSALEPLRASWPFDVAQRGYKVVFVARGGSSIATIDAADLDARQDGTAPGVQITTGREMDSQLPRRVAIQHLDYDREYDAGTQYAERLNTAAINLVAHDLPIVLTATEAAGKAEVLLYLAWLERYDVAINLPPTYNQLEPGDVVTLVTPDGNVSLRLTAITYTADGRVECTAKYANPAIYTPTAVGAAGQSTGTATIPRVGPSLYTLLDIPLVHDAQASPGFPVAMCGTLAGWNGGVLMQSTDAGSTWSAIEDFGPPGAAIGQASTSIGAVESRMIDKASRLTVVLTSGDLYDTTELAMLGGANHFAYGVDGRWEIIAAQKCTLQSGTTYILSDLLRGRYGTEQYMGTHATGDSVVLLDVDDLAIVAMSSNTIGLARDYRGITLDQDISSDSSRTFTYAAINLKPLAPIALTGNRDPASNDWALAWVRRTRSGGEWRDYVEADLAESAEQYQVDIFADGSYATVKRTLWIGGPSASYLSADQVTDFGSNQATLYLKIYQMSATVGRGYPLTTSITR